MEKPLGSANQSAQAFEILRKAIINGDLRPNQRLVERRIAKELKMSRTPVREALSELLIKGYVARLDGGGLAVSKLSARKVQNLMEIRQILETKALELSCKRITKEHLEKAYEYHIQCLEAIEKRDIELFTELNQAFHNELTSGCNNEHLEAILETIRDLYTDIGVMRSITDRSWRGIGNQHERLYKAVSSGNAAMARKAIREHIKLFTRVALEQIQEE